MNKKADLVSIIIPTYNRAIYIVEAIESCIQQTYRKIEIIVIDDGSTDNTSEILEPYISSSQIIFIRQENNGVASARNQGLDIATGEFIQFLDSDDLIAKDKIEKQVQFLLENQQFFGVYSDTHYFHKTIENIDSLYRKFEKHSGSLLNRLTTSNFIALNSMLIRKTKTRFNTSLLLEDWYFWLELSLQNKTFSYIDEKLNYVRLHDNHRSGNKDEMLRGELIILDKLQNTLAKMSKVNYARYRRLKKLKLYKEALNCLELASREDSSYTFRYYKSFIKYKILHTL